MTFGCTLFAFSEALVVWGSLWFCLLSLAATSKP